MKNLLSINNSGALWSILLICLYFLGLRHRPEIIAIVYAHALGLLNFFNNISGLTVRNLLYFVIILKNRGDHCDFLHYCRNMTLGLSRSIRCRYRSTVYKYK